MGLIVPSTPHAVEVSGLPNPNPPRWRDAARRSRLSACRRFRAPQRRTVERSPGGFPLRSQPSRTGATHRETRRDPSSTSCARQPPRWHSRLIDSLSSAGLAIGLDDLVERASQSYPGIANTLSHTWIVDGGGWLTPRIAISGEQSLPRGDRRAGRVVSERIIC